MADRHDLFDLIRLIRHDGRRTASDQDVGAVVNRHVIRDVVDEGVLLFYVVK
jgi:hypothetical protein